jgi:tRNA(Ile)-lysidine synthase
MNKRFHDSHSDLAERVGAVISHYSMLHGGETVLVGLSGGPDSVCLLTVLHRFREDMGLILNALYIDHGLRPDETPAEIAFCDELCRRLSIPFLTKKIDVMACVAERRMNKQEAARELRYRTYEEVLFQVRGGRIALGHTADDQLETFLMRLLRGAGPKGLSGIPPVRGNIIRPLIEIERADIAEYLDRQGIGYVNDASNFREDYLRNRIRKGFIPAMKRANPSIIRTIQRTMAVLRDEERYFDIITTKNLMRLISRKSDSRIELFLVPMETMEKVVLRRVLRRAIEETRGLRGIEFIHIEEIIDLIKKGRSGDRIYLPNGVRAIRNYATVVITSETPGKIGTIPLMVPGEAVSRECKVVIRASVEESADISFDGKTASLFDADKTGMQLIVRSRREGDFFFPSGFGKRKKLQDFFVDEKVPRDERDEIPIVVSGTDIVWIAGYRGDERFRTTRETERFLRLELKKGL